MKRLRYYFCIFCLLIGTSTIIAQKLTVGLATGPNFSNIRGDYQYGKWNSKMGTVSGLWVNYSPVPALSFGTEVNYISLFYQHINYTEYYNSPEYDIRMLPTILREQSWDLNFLRVPFYVKLSTPTRLRFDLLAGAYYAHLLSPKKDTYYSDSYPKNEFGWLVGAGFSYPLTEKIELFLQGRYAIGGKKYMADGKNGDFELMLGVGYSLFNKMNIRYPSASEDSIFRFTMKYKAGVMASWVKADEGQDVYSPGWGFTTGVAFNYALGENVGIQTELLFEDKGYRMADSTSSYFRYIPQTRPTGDYYYASDYYANTKIEIAYLTIPLMLQFKTSGPYTVFANTGIYYSGRLKSKTVGSATQEYKSEGSYSLVNIDVYDNLDGAIKPCDWGWIVGGGVQFPLKNGWKLDIESRYQQGWTNILESVDYPEKGSTQSMKNRALSVLLGLQIPIR